MTTQQAIQFLHDKGYYVQNLWHISDVQNRFECTSEEAQDILYNVHNNDAIVERIFEGIDFLGNFNRYKKKKDENM
jgi:hypothetical protein